MMRLTLEEIASSMGAFGDFETGEDLVVSMVRTDSRLVQPGDLFVCIAGRNMDGHFFAAEAVQKGACAVVAHTPMLDLPARIPVLLVRNTLHALGRLAGYWRSKTKACVIGISGSAGKTTVKEMLSSVLGLVGETAKNYKNWNNQLGLPLSILQCSGEERFWVMEAGISRVGDMEELGDILHPDYVLLNNIGPCHLDGLKDLAGVARAKATLVEYMSPLGAAFISGDYPELVEEVRQRTSRFFLFSTRTPECPRYAHYKDIDKEGQGVFSLHLDDVSLDVRLSVTGRDMAEDVVAVATVAKHLGIPDATIAAGLSAYTPVGQRFCVQERDGWVVIDDTYNANPLSMQGAIQRAAGLGPADRLVLVLGEMKELGTYAAEAHRALGQWVRDSGSLRVFFVGKHSEDVRAGLDDWTGNFVTLDSPAAFRSEAASLGETGVVLFKGSRSCRMEEYLSIMQEVRG